MIRMRDRVGGLDAKPLAALKLPFPIDLVVDRGREPFVMETLVVTFNRGKKFGEQALGPLVALGGIDRERRTTACAIGRLMGPEVSLTLMVR
jgi:hypothetical protein